MTWEEDLFALFDDLEQQADAAFVRERDLEIADRSQAEYAQVTLASRLMASLGAEPVRLEVIGLGSVRGEIHRVGSEWCLLAGGGQEWIVRLAAVASAHGVSSRSVPEIAWSPVTRLGLGSALRRLSVARERCLVHLLDGHRLEVLPGRVGSDFVEVSTGESATALVAFTAIAAVQRRDPA